MTTMTARTRTAPAAAKRPKPAARKSGHVTPEHLLQFAYVSDPQISPDGTQIVFVRKQAAKKRGEYVTNLWIADTAGKTAPRQYTSGGKDAQPRWSPDGARIAFVSGREKPKPQVWTIPAAGGEAVALTTFPEGSIGAIKWSPDGTRLAVSFRAQDPLWTDEAKKKRTEEGLSDPPRVLDDIWYRFDGDGYFGAQRYELFIVDAATGAHSSVYSKDALGFFSFDFAPDGKRMVIGTNRERRALAKDWNEELLVLELAGGKLKAIPGLPRGPKNSVAWSPAGDLIAFAGRDNTEVPDDIYSTENIELWVCDPVRGRARSLTGGEDYCLMGIAISDSAEVAFAPTVRWSPDGSRLYVQIGWHGESHVASVPARGGPLTFLTRGAAVHQLGNVSRDGKRLALTRATVTELDEVFVGEVSAKEVSAKRLTTFNTKLLSDLDLAAIESHWVKSADGTRVQTWVMRPPGTVGKAGKRHPAVLEIHGGPHAQYGVGYFHEFQCLAAAGYVVVFSNPRGSKGYGRDHTAAIRGAWGGVDWVDLQAVVEFMKDSDGVDPRRLGVMGGSYGGYMTNWAIGHCDDFAAAITDRCVSNLLSMGGNSDFPDRPDHYWQGNCWDRPEVRWEQSPLKYLGNARTPTLIIHSEGDLRCNIEQGEQVFSALYVRNVPVRFVRYPRTTSHGMSRSGPPDLRLHRLGEILDWWGKYLK